MRIYLFSAIIAAVALSGVPGQTQADLPVFEVVPIKPSSPQGGRMEINGFYTYPGGRVVGHGCTLEYLIELAFRVLPIANAGCAS
jgi:hypothetical protein